MAPKQAKVQKRPAANLQSEETSDTTWVPSLAKMSLGCPNLFLPYDHSQDVPRKCLDVYEMPGGDDEVSICSEDIIAATDETSDPPPLVASDIDSDDIPDAPHTPHKSERGETRTF